MCIFARHITDDLTSLVKQIEVVVARQARMRGLVMFLSDDQEALKPRLKALARKHNIKCTSLAIFEDGSAGPYHYKIARTSEVTIIMWVKGIVKVNFAFAKGELNKASIKQVVAATSKILK